jgi:ABC-type Fe3+ transport system substrate-binding protein
MSTSGRISRRALVAGAGASALAGRFAQAQAPTDWQAGAPAEWARILEAGQKEGQITVAAFAGLGDKMGAAFKRDTGIQMNFLGGSSTEQSIRMEAEARAKNLTIDCLLGGGRELGPMMRDGMLEPVAPQLMLPGVTDPKNFRGGKLKWMDNSQTYLIQGAQYVFGWLVVNKDMVKLDEVNTWKKLLDPKWRGKIASYDLRGPGPGQGSAAALYRIFGIDYIKEFFVDQKVNFTTDNRGLVEGVVRGQTAIAFGAIQQDVERFRSAGFNNLAIVLPDDMPGYLTGGFSVLKQAKGVPHPNAAKVFINWYMSRPGQEVYESVMLETSRRLDVNTGVPDYLVPRPGVNYYEAFSEEEYFSRNDVIGLINKTLGAR